MSDSLWTQIDDNDVRMVWRCEEEDCPDNAVEIYINPDTISYNYAERCSPRGRNSHELTYLRTDMKVRGRLSEHYGYWRSHPHYTIEDWQQQVLNDDTRLGYWEWVTANMEETL